MANLTVSLDEGLIKQARLRAIQEGTSVSAKVRELLSRYARGLEGAQPQAVQVALPVFDGKKGLVAGIGPCSNKSLLAAAEDGTSA